MTARETLDGIRAQIAAVHAECADCGKCRAMPNAEEWCSDCGYFSCEHGSDCADAAPSTVARLSNAVEAVLALHGREVLAVHESYGEEAWCPKCRVHWPCENYAAIENALKEGQ